MSEGPQDIDVGQLMEVICGYRKERYRFERIVSLLTFSGWLRWPNDSEILSQVRLISAANVITAVDRGLFKVPKAQRKRVIDQLCRVEFRLLDAATALVKPAVSHPFLVTYDKSMPHLFDAAMVAYFFVRCDPDAHPPSYNKAFFFIQHGGYVYNFETTRKKETAPYKFSQSQIKLSWSYFATTSAFSLAAQLLELNEEILFLPPDREYSSIEAKNLLDKPAKLRRYFRFSRTIHERLVQRLDDRSKMRVDQVAFPDSIKPYKLFELDPFQPDQIAIIEKYSLKKEKEERKGS
jgi:hypothetical protein